MLKGRRSHSAGNLVFLGKICVDVNVPRYTSEGKSMVSVHSHGCMPDKKALHADRHYFCEGSKFKNLITFAFVNRTTSK